MPTNAIGAGTRNASINFPEDEIDKLRQVAARLVNAGLFRSVSAAYRQFMVIGAALYDPQEVIGIRALRNAAASAALLALVCWSTWQAWSGSDDVTMRARRGRSVARVSIRGSRTRTGTDNIVLLPVLDGIDDQPIQEAA